MITVCETIQFFRKAKKLLAEHEKEDLIDFLSVNPTTGTIIEGTGGVRKLRWSKTGSGKSGGLRVIYYYHSNFMPVYLLTLFGKNEKTNLTRNDKCILAKGIKTLLTNWRNKK